MEKDDVTQALAEAEMILVGLGEEFNGARYLQQDLSYLRGRAWLEEEGRDWLIPAWMEYCLGTGREILEWSVGKLAHILEGKNYFVVSVATSRAVALAPWREGRFVAPCGTTLMKQCQKDCVQTPIPVTEEDTGSLECAFGRIGQEMPNLGHCPDCGKPYVLNTVYVPDYDERGYLEGWQRYTKWLQGTVNRRLAILELGVGMQFPSVIRWPFEKIAFYNQKASFFRVNGHLHHLTQELAGKGLGISQNAIDWLDGM